VMPARLVASHICTGSGKLVMSDLILPVLKHMFGCNHRLRIVLHAGSSKEVLREFQDHGLREEHMKACYGGLVGNTERREE